MFFHVDAAGKVQAAQALLAFAGSSVLTDFTPEYVTSLPHTATEPPVALPALPGGKRPPRHWSLCHLGAKQARRPVSEFVQSRSEAVLQGLKSSFQLKLSTSRFVQSKFRRRKLLAEPWDYHITKGGWLLRYSQGHRRQTLAIISTMITAHLRYCAISCRQLDDRAIGLQSSAWGALLTRHRMGISDQYTNTIY